MEQKNKKGVPLGAGSEKAESEMLIRHSKKMEKSIVRAYGEGNEKELIRNWEFSSIFLFF